MKSKHMAVLGVGACAAACAVSLAVPALFGAGVFGIGGAVALFGGVSGEVVICGLGALAIIGAMVLLLRRNSAVPKQCASDGTCGCNPGKADAMGDA